MQSDILTAMRMAEEFGYRLVLHHVSERGKDADLVLFDGDPFEYTTKTTHVIIGGKVMKE